MVTEKAILLRLVVGCILGGLIGWERELNDRPAGFRTHILVTVGSALIMIISINIFHMFPDSDADPGRIAAQVVSGIGFLGAGTIIREGINVRGLTTAASLWAVAAIGLAIGAGFYFSGIATTGLVYVALMFLNRINFTVTERKMLIIRAIDRPGLLGDIGQLLAKNHLNISNITMDKNSDDDLIRVKIKVKTPPDFRFENINDQLYQIVGISHLEWFD